MDGEMKDFTNETDKDDTDTTENSYDYDIDVSEWVNAQVPKSRTKIDRSPNRAMYIKLLLARVPYRELVRIAKDKWGESFSVRGFCLFNNKIPEEIKDPINRMEKFIKEAPYRVNEILMMEELASQQRERFKMASTFENTAKVPLGSRSQVGRDLHSLLVDLQEAKMKAGIITKTPERVEITGGVRSVSEYTQEEKDKELERINDKLNNKQTGK